MPPDSVIRHSKIGFLFNHDQIHQVPHSVPILNALCEANAEIELFAFVSGDDQEALVRKLLTPAATRRTAVIGLSCPAFARRLDAMLGKVVPITRVMTLLSNKRRFAGLDVLVAPETTCTLLKTRFGLRRLKLVYTQHGAGDRAIGFKPVIRNFDHVFVAGEKIRDRLLDEELIRRDGHSVVGYPKFDLVDLSDKTGNSFGNTNLTVLYNPHFDPLMSSWFDHGVRVLDFFARRPDLNLIFAPHVMLFARRLHASNGLARIRWRKNIPERFFKCNNIHIDTGSFASVDMTYIMEADVYIGDVSSQVYEFLHRPRPCIFINCHDAPWENDPSYAHWHLGPVIRTACEIDDLLGNLQNVSNRYAERQKIAFERTFGPQVTGGGQCAARALLHFLRLESRI